MAGSLKENEGESLEPTDTEFNSAFEKWARACRVPELVVCDGVAAVLGGGGDGAVVRLS